MIAENRQNRHFSFNISDFSDKLQPAKEKGHYMCPACGGHNLTINADGKRYNCHNCGDKKAIARILAGNSDRPQNTQQFAPKSPKIKAAPIPDEIELAVLPDMPEMPGRVKIDHEYQVKHWYGQDKYVLRWEQESGKKSKDDKRRHRPWHKDSEGGWQCARGDDPWPMYREDEIKQYGAGKWILIVEGEKCVDFVRCNAGLIATTFQGSLWTETALYGYCQKLSAYGVAGILIWPDHDVPKNSESIGTGDKKADSVCAAAAKSKMPVIRLNHLDIDPTALDHDDVIDFWQKQDTMTGDELIKILYAQIALHKEHCVGTEIAEEIPDYPPDDDQILCDDVTPELAIFENIFNTGNWIALNDSYYRYSGTHWELQENSEIYGIIARQLKKCYTLAKAGKDDFKRQYPYFTDTKKKSTFGICLSGLQELSQQLKSDRGTGYYRCFNNGVVNLQSGELLPHDKKYLLTTKINADYKPGSDCPQVFKDFVTSSYGEKYLDIFRALISMYIDPSAPYGYFAYFVGTSGSGKGTAIRFLGKLFDRIGSLNNFSELMSPESRHQNLSGVDFACFSDVSSGYHSGLEAFYELVDNGCLNGRPLYSKDSYSKNWNCRFAVASVHAIRVENSQSGWARRALIIPSKAVAASDRDNQLEQKLDNAKAEIISWALGIGSVERDRLLREYMNNDTDLKNIRREHEIDSDSIKGFIDRCLRPSADAGEITPDKLYKFYSAYCKESGYKSLNLDNFKNRLKTAIPGFYVARKQKRVNGQQTWISQHFKNISVVESGFIENLHDPGKYNCSLSNCTEGGLEMIEEYLQELNRVPVTSVTTTANSNDLGVVTPEMVTPQGFQALSPASPTSPAKTLNFAEKNDFKNKIADDAIFSLNKEVCPSDAGDAGDTTQNSVPATISAVTTPLTCGSGDRVDSGDSDDYYSAPINIDILHSVSAATEPAPSAKLKLHLDAKVMYGGDVVTVWGVDRDGSVEIRYPGSNKSIKVKRSQLSPID